MPRRVSGYEWAREAGERRNENTSGGDREVNDNVGETFETLSVSGQSRGVEWSRLAPTERMGVEQLSAPYEGPWELL